MIDALRQADLFAEFPRFMISLTRASGLVVFCPIFSSQVLPRRFRFAIAFVLAAVLLPSVPTIPAIPNDVASWSLLVTRELAAGLALGIAARVVVDGIEGASRLVAGQSGFAMASMIDPMTGAQSVTPALFQALMVTSLILAADLHHLFIRGLARSYSALPPMPALPAAGGLEESVVMLGARMFDVAIHLAAPALVVTFSVDLVLLLVGRAIPQIPVLMVGYPLKVGAGLVAMFILILAAGTAIGWIGRTFSSDGAAVLGALGAR